ncbi:hypothetical protein [Synechococcus sp. UW179A]|uniref:hypothetical protein n=1 Tax=Synechococcus sp. UW179A TaxID=2575510 RepID=UPI0010BE3E6F|nr:hypothetical protein [Synechococcus sp. UW179A]
MAAEGDDGLNGETCWWAKALLGCMVSGFHQPFTRNLPVVHQSCAALFTRRTVSLKESRGSTPKHPRSPLMSFKSTFVYTLSLTLGIAAVTQAKTLLIEQAPQETSENQESVDRTCQLSLYEIDRSRGQLMTPIISYAPAQ